MEVEEERPKQEGKKRIATQAEKRLYFKEQILDFFFKGDHVLSKFLDRKVFVHMEEEDREALLDRLLKTPDGEQQMTFYTINCLVLKHDIFDLFRDKKTGEMKFTIKRMELTDTHLELKKLKSTPTVQVIFKHLSPPSKAEGGWPSKNLNLPQLVAYHKFFNAYPEYVAHNTRNGDNLAYAWEHDMPIDYAVMRYNKSKIDPLMRVIVFEPYKEVQEGFNMFIPI